MHRLLLGDRGEHRDIRGREPGGLVEAVEHERAAGGLEGALGSPLVPSGFGCTRRTAGDRRGTQTRQATRDEDGGGVPLRGHHLAGNEALPDDLVEAEVVRAERTPDALGRELERSGADGLVGFLRILVGGCEEVGLLGEVLVAELAGDVVAGHLQRGAGNVRAVGTHICDEAGRAFAGNVHTFIERLCGLHGAPRAEAQARGRGLLERGGDERGRGAGAGALGLDGGDGVFGGRIDGAADGATELGGAAAFFVLDGVDGGDLEAGEGGDVADLRCQIGSRGIPPGTGGVPRAGPPELELGAVDFDEFGLDGLVVGEPLELRLAGGRVALLVLLGHKGWPRRGELLLIRIREREVGEDVPELIGDEGADGPLTLDDETDGDGLHAPGAEAAGDFFP